MSSLKLLNMEKFLKWQKKIAKKIEQNLTRNRASSLNSTVWIKWKRRKTGVKFKLLWTYLWCLHNNRCSCIGNLTQITKLNIAALIKIQTSCSIKPVDYHGFFTWQCFLHNLDDSDGNTGNVTRNNFYVRKRDYDNINFQIFVSFVRSKSSNPLFGKPMAYIFP